VECSTSRLIFEHVVHILIESQSSETNSYSGRRCVNMNDFARFIKEFVPNDQRLVLVSVRRTLAALHNIVNLFFSSRCLQF
jgi:hypothetical protein